jgi:phosphatidylethanolamine/phosphatidyl-N-methylethanolamine N-methyltransferase
VSKNYLEFFRQFRERYETTGAIAPSSRGLARAMSRPLRESEHRPARVLEIGPGTGAVTGHIIQALGPEDTFDLVELNESFADVLRKRFDTDPQWLSVSDRSELHVCPIQEFQSEAPYDFIVSGLPLNNFPADLVEEIFRVYFRLLAPAGVLSYFEYMYVRTLRKRIGKNEARERLSKIDDTMNSYVQRHRFKRDSILINLPPAWVQHLRNGRS